MLKPEHQKLLPVRSQPVRHLQEQTRTGKQAHGVGRQAGTWCRQASKHMLRGIKIKLLCLSTGDSVTWNITFLKFFLLLSCRYMHTVIKRFASPFLQIYYIYVYCNLGLHGAYGHEMHPQTLPHKWKKQNK